MDQFDTTMQKDLVINNRELVYKGIFIVNNLFKAINLAIEKKGYTKREKKTEELVTEKGRRSYIELRPYKKITAYARTTIKMKIILDKVTETDLDLGNGMQKFQQGDVRIIFDAWVMTDYNMRWGMKPLAYFIKGWVNKFLYKFPLESGFKGIVSEDTGYIYSEILKELRSYTPKDKKEFSEENIRAEMAEEIGSS